MKKQRVTTNLGLNRSQDKEKIYRYIENVLGIKEKYYSRGTSDKKSKYGVKHKGPNPLPIRFFNLQYAYVDTDGNIKIESKDGLQTYCINCERAYRRGRLNRWYKKYAKMSDEEVYEDYKKNYGMTAHCSRCGEDKPPEEFPISRRMDKGLHNTCKECSKSYSESVGNRWIIYSPDGHEVIDIKRADVCSVCGKSDDLHKDHIWPIAKGGTDNKENIQILCAEHNLSKSDSIHGFRSVHEIHPKMICERYRDVLKKAKEEDWFNFLEVFL